MTNYITHITDYIGDFLKQDLEGVVHSVYQKTINLLINEQMLSLQAVNSPISPISLITNLGADQMGLLSVQSGQKVSFDFQANVISIQGAASPLAFHMENAHICAANLRKPCKVSPVLFSDHNVQLIGNALDLSACNGFRSLFSEKNPISDSTAADEPLILAAAKNRLKNCQHRLFEKDCQGAAKELSGLIGLGIGLTPSGDDFLCGMLAGFLLLDKSTHPLYVNLSEQIQKQLLNTNHISAAFLSCALAGYFSQAVMTLPSMHSPEEIVETFEKIGHSSGMDTLCGIYYAVSLCRNFV